MYPCAFIDEFGVWQMVAYVDVPVQMERNISGTALKVVALLGSSYGGIKPWTAIAAGDRDGSAGMPAKWLENLLTEVLDIWY